MHEIALQYDGKKKPFQFDHPKTGKLTFSPGMSTWVRAESADWLMRINPKMFTKTGERGGEDIFEDATDMIAAKKDTEKEDDALLESAPPATDKEQEPETMACPKCKREYKDKLWFDKHIAKCEG